MIREKKSIHIWHERQSSSEEVESKQAPGMSATTKKAKKKQELEY